MTREISLFLHSTGTGPAMWHGLAGRVVGAGLKRTPAHIGYPPEPLLVRGTRVSSADDAAHVLARLPLGDLHIYAHSYGGLVALQLLPLIGPRAKSLFIYEPAMLGALREDESVPLDPAGRAEIHALMRRIPWLLDEDRGGSEAWLEVFIDYWNRPGAWSRLPPDQRAALGELGWKMFQEVRSGFRDVVRFDALPIGGAVATTLAMGQLSPKASRAVVCALAHVNPTVRVVELAGAGHMAPLTHASQVGQLMLEHARRARDLRAP